MSSPRGPRGRLPWRAPLAALLAVAALTPASAAAMSSPAADPNLSARLDELADPALRTAPRAEQAARLSLPVSGPGSLLRDGNRVLVEVRFASGAGLDPAALRAAGAEIVQLGRRYRTATVATRTTDLGALGAVAGVATVTEALAPLVRGADCGGAGRSEGDAQLGAAGARAAFGVDGTGVTVGILSDSFDRDSSTATRAAGDVASGDLPGPGSPCGSSAPVRILDDGEPGGSDEGRAMAQIVHDLAPGAAIDFATAFTGESGFAANIRALAGNGAGVIADDVSYFQEPFFQDGPVAVAVNEAVAGGVSYFAAAGNDNLIDEEGREIASWEAPGYRDSGSCPAAVVELSDEIKKAEAGGGVPSPQGLRPDHCMDFDPGAAVDDSFGITVEVGQELAVDLQWAEPWNGVGTDLDAFLLDEDDQLVEVNGSPVTSTEDNVGDSQRPFEFLSWENKDATREVRLVINRFSGGDPRLKVALLENGRGVRGTEYPESSQGDVVGPAIFGHAGASAAIAVGAVRFDDATRAERFSSRGPVKHYFGPVVGPAPAAATGERVIAKPDLMASDGGLNTFFGVPAGALWRFFGTSAAAPHAAAVAALMRQANPALPSAWLRTALMASARPVGAYGPFAVGAGLIDANAAVAAVAAPPAVRITKAPAPLSRNRRPTIEFGANRPVVFSCEVDGGPAQPCASPFVVPAALADGRHGIAVTGVDLAGRSGASGAAGFTIDTRAPRTSIAKHPPKSVRIRHRRVRGTFRFASNEADVAFVCKVDRGLPRFCGRRISRRFGAGRHVVRVRARDRAGNVDASAAVFRFRVRRVG